jgi:hypothetical protein
MLGLCMVIKMLVEPFVVLAGYENGGLYCYDLRTHEILSSKKLHSELCNYQLLSYNHQILPNFLFLAVLCLEVESETKKMISGAADTKVMISQLNLENVCLSFRSHIALLPDSG